MRSRLDNILTSGSRLGLALPKVIDEVRVNLGDYAAFKAILTSCKIISLHIDILESANLTNDLSIMREDMRILKASQDLELVRMSNLLLHKFEDVQS
jgi:hypothetical protein